MDYRRELATAEATRGQSSKPRALKKGLFAPASRAFSDNISTSTGTRKPSLLTLETGNNLFFYKLW